MNSIARYCTAEHTLAKNFFADVTKIIIKMKIVFINDTNDARITSKKTPIKFMKISYHNFIIKWSITCYILQRIMLVEI